MNDDRLWRAIATQKGKLKLLTNDGELQTAKSCFVNEKKKLPIGLN
jgi:hypothetical protein